MEWVSFNNMSLTKHKLLFLTGDEPDDGYGLSKATFTLLTENESFL